MANVVTIDYLYGAPGDGTRQHVVSLSGVLDTAHEAGVVKINVSDFTNDNHTNDPATQVAIDKIEWSIFGGAIDFVQLHFDEATDDLIITMTGTGEIDYTSIGGSQDPRSTTPVGDIKLTTGSDTAIAAGTLEAHYSVTIWFRTKH